MCTHTRRGDTHSQQRFENASSKSIRPSLAILRSREPSENADDEDDEPLCDEYLSDGRLEDELEDDPLLSEDEVRGRRDDMLARWGRRNKDGDDREDILEANGLGRGGRQTRGRPETRKEG